MCVSVLEAAGGVKVPQKVAEGGKQTMKTTLRRVRTRFPAQVGDIAAIAVVGTEGEEFGLETGKYRLGIVKKVREHGRVDWIDNGKEWRNDDGLALILTPHQVKYEEFLAVLKNESPFRKWTLDEIYEFISPFRK
jgi:hypothetical protein